MGIPQLETIPGMLAVRMLLDLPLVNLGLVEQRLLEPAELELKKKPVGLR